MTRPSNSAQTASRASIEELAARGGITAEHVVLGGTGHDDLPPERSTVVRFLIELHNPVRGSRTELRIFKDYFMSVTERRGKRRTRERTIDLKYLDPSPKLSRYIAKKTARVVLICSGVTALVLLLAILSVWPAVTGLLALISLAAAAAFAWRYAVKTRDTVEFQTTNGKAVVISLVANIGCMRAYRNAVPQLVTAIRHANGKIENDKATQLRSEVREHYRLARIGVIDKSTCEQATRLILNKY